MATVRSLACIASRPEAIDVHAYSEQQFLWETGAGKYCSLKIAA